MRISQLLRRDGVACVIGLLRSKSDGVALYEVGDSALSIIRYSAPSEIRIVELSAVRKLLDGLAPAALEDDAHAGVRVREIHPG